MPAFLLSLVLSFAPALAPAAQAMQSAQPVHGAPLTVMTFNIRYGAANDGDNHWLKRREQLFALPREQQADVVGVQEALHGQIERICTWAYFEDREGPAFYVYNVHLDHQSQPS